MKRIFVFLLATTILISSVGIISLAESYFDTDGEMLYRTDGSGVSSAYCWTDLTYSTSSNTVKADCWINYRNSYPNRFHNCVELNTFTSTGRATSSNYSDSERNIVVTKVVASNFTWCYASHGANACGRVNLPLHDYDRDSGSDYVVLFATVRVS